MIKESITWPLHALSLLEEDEKENKISYTIPIIKTIISL